MTEDKALQLVEAALSPADRAAIIERTKGTNLNGAQVADVLSILSSTDAYVAEVEEAIEARPSLNVALVGIAAIASMWIHREMKPEHLDAILTSARRCPRCTAHLSYTGTANEPYCSYTNCLWNNEPGSGA